METWFTPPIVVPLGLAVIVIAFAIYSAYVHPVDRARSVGVPVKLRHRRRT